MTDEILHDHLAPRAASTPIVVYAHIPLWAVYPKWGWGTDDSEQALALLKRFGSVTVSSTAFPQPAPGMAPAPGPVQVTAARLRATLGVHTVDYRGGHSALAIVDMPLG